MKEKINDQEMEQKLKENKEKLKEEAIKIVFASFLLRINSFNQARSIN